MAHILVVDDDPAIREFVCAALELEGHTTSVAAHGAAGVELARRLAPDLVLLDLMMPVLDGPGVIHALRSDPATANLCIVVMSAGITLRAHLAHLQVDGVLLKPFDLEGLYSEVARCLQHTGAT